MTITQFKMYYCLSFIILLFVCCEDKKSLSDTKTTTPKGIVENQNLLKSKEKAPFSEAIDKGIIENTAITEASGLAASRINKGLFWTHNDSKDASRLFLFDENGRDKGVYYLDKATNRDWEDMTIVTINSTPYIYVADIGDNDGTHGKKYIYRIKEPKLRQSDKPVVDTLRETETLIIKYPDGNRNAETMIIDQKTFDIYIVSKFEDNVQVYLIPYPQSTTQPNMAQLLVKLPMTYVTGGTISPDNQEILIKNLDNIFYWQREKDETIASALKRPATILPYKKEPQGEAIAFAADGSGYYTLSEMKKRTKPHLYFYKRN